MCSYFTRFVTLAAFFIVTSAEAKIEVLFHPRDPTLEKIALWIEQAEHQVDIAMYNMDTTEASPLIKLLMSESVRGRLQSGNLKIRFLFEGYGTTEENAAKMQALENLGIDARYLGRGVKVHHKFATLDTGTVQERVVSGSANWSLSSYRNYNENILFFDAEPEASDRFQSEFNLLWSEAKAFGFDLEIPDQQAGSRDQEDFVVHFNSPSRLKIDPEHALLTDQIVRAINEAQSTIDIASTRIRLVPILEAISAAADRGVQIRIVLNQDDYHDLSRRTSYLEKPGVQLRVKFFNLKPGSYLTYQMHHKFLVVDGKKVFTGSFNWSESSEKSHIENLIEFGGQTGSTLAKSYTADFESLWGLGRDQLESLKARLAETKSAGKSYECAFAPTTMVLNEIQFLLQNYRSCGK